MASTDLRGWAVKGAEQRLLEIAEEARAIFQAFPELRQQGRGFNLQSTGTPRTKPADTTRQRQRRAASPPADDSRGTEGGRSPDEEILGGEAQGRGGKEQVVVADS